MCELNYKICEFLLTILYMATLALLIEVQLSSYLPEGRPLYGGRGGGSVTARTQVACLDYNMIATKDSDNTLRH